MQLQKQERSRPGLEKPPAAPDAQHLAEEAGALIAEFQEKLDQTLRVFKLKAAKQVAHDLPDIAEKLLERYSKQHEKLALDTAEELKNVVKAVRAEAGEAASAQFAAARQEALDGFVNDSKAAAGKAVSEAGASVLAQGGNLAERANEAVRSIHSAAGEAARKLQSAREQMDASLTAEHQQRWNELAASGLKDLASRAEANVEACRKRFESSLKEVTQRAAAKVEQDVSNAAGGLLERSTAEMRRQTDSVREKLVTELRNSGTAILEETQQKFAHLETASSEALNRSARAAAENAVSEAIRRMEDRAQAEISRSAETSIARIGDERQKLLAQAERSAADHKQHLDQLADESLEGARRKLDSQRDLACSRLQDDAEAFGKRTLERAAQDFPLVVESLVGKTASGFEKRLSDLLEQAKQELQVSAAGAAEKIRQRFSQEAEVALRSLSDSALDQSRSQLNQLCKDAAAAGRKQFESEIEQSLRKQRRSAQAQIDDIARASFEQLRQFDTQAAPSPARAPFKAHLFLILVAFIPTVIFAYLATRPVMRLEATPPADFLAAYPEWSSGHAAASVRLSQAYWDWAALHLVPGYPYGSKLPEQPPVSFEVDGTSFPAGVEADVARERYWQKLRTLWVEPQSWQRVEIWNAH
ncbi:MAG: hypothetical protein ACRD3D_03005 [Terriglobia bacterium]